VDILLASAAISTMVRIKGMNVISRRTDAGVIMLTTDVKFNK